MKLLTLNEELVKFKKDFNKERLLKASCVSLKCSFATLYIYIEQDIAATVILRREIKMEEIKDKMICSYKAINGKEKEVLQIKGDEKALFKLKKNITKYNKYLGYKSPLVVNLIQKNQEPISTDDNVKFDYKGFVYVIIMFSLLNFWDLIMEIMREHGDVLVDNVS